MIKVYLRNIVRFFTVVLLQVLLFDNIEFSGYVNPYFYVIFILLMPFESPKWLLLLMAFLLGLSVDLFSMTPGMHTSAALAMAFARPFVLNTFAPRDGYEPGTFPRVHYYGLLWFMRYTIILVFIHHLMLFSIESFSFSAILQILLRTILSSLLTTIFIVISQYFIYRR